LLTELRKRERDATTDTRTNTKPRDAAEDYLKVYLTDGEPKPAAQAIADAMKALACSRRTVQRAAESIGVVVTYTSNSPPQVTWTLPKEVL
jgi:hypothetical protein